MAETPATPDIARLVAEHHESVYRYAYRLTGSVHDAEDLTQQTFLTAQRKMGDLRKIDAARKWLCAILRNCFLRERQRRRPTLAADLEVRLDPVAPDVSGSDSSDPARLQEALNGLPDGFRLAVVMFFFEECSYREIADELGVPMGTVMSRLARAKGHLRSILVDAEKKAEKKVPAPAGSRGDRARVV
jgi:RNA polymerase sigma-70 factor (ECF subfamily)